jgi:hypothetical protein
VAETHAVSLIPSEADQGPSGQNFTKRPAYGAGDLCTRAMETDYTAAITAMVVIGALLTAGVVFVLRRPNDLNG